MDPKQFDELVARLASTASRRNAVKGVLGGTLASAGVTSVVSAKKKGKASAKPDNKKSKDKASAEKKKECKGQPPRPICHKGKKTLTLPACAADKHIKKHGKDTEGPCPYGDE